MTNKEHNWTHGLMAVNREDFLKVGNDLDILHIVMYEQSPSLREYRDIYHELASDEEFGLTDEMEDVIIVPAPKKLIEEYNTI